MYLNELLEKSEIALDKDDMTKIQFSFESNFKMKRLIFLTIFIKFVKSEYCDRRFEKRLETLKVVDQHLDYLWNILDEQVQDTHKAVLESRIKSNKLDYNYIVVNVLGNILKSAGRVSKSQVSIIIFTKKISCFRI